MTLQSSADLLKGPMPSQLQDSFKARASLKVGAQDYQYVRLAALEEAGHCLGRLPISIRILLENLLRHEDGLSVTKKDIEAVANWDAKAAPAQEIAFRPARVLLQDFTGVPAVVDLAAMREAIKKLGGDPKQINPLQAADLVIDHSVQVDHFGSPDSLEQNIKREFERNQERYEFLRWGQQSFNNFRVVPPGAGIVHQVNLEYLAQVVFKNNVGANGGSPILYPDSLVGTDSHTTMINGLGVLGWGVGGIEAEAAMLGQPISMLVPHVVGFRLTGDLPAGSTATDLVLTVVQMLRARGVVGKFVEFFGSGVQSLSLADQATIANMAPEYGATIGFFPVTEQSLSYLRMTGRDEAHIRLVASYLKEQGLFVDKNCEEPEFSDVLELDLATVQPSIAGPKRPQDRVLLSEAKSSFKKVFESMVKADQRAVSVPVQEKGNSFTMHHGNVVIAAITSCTNTSNPTVMLGAGLLAKKAVESGLQVKPWVKTSLAPGSKVVEDYLKKSGLLVFLETLKFNVVGFGCTTCIGNSGPLPEAISQAIEKNNLLAVSVLSGNRNFEGRVNPQCRANYLASPPLVVAYALAGTMDIDFERDPLGGDQKNKAIYLRDLWPSPQEIQAAIGESINPEMFRQEYKKIFEGSVAWQNLPSSSSDLFEWDEKSTYIKQPPFFEGMGQDPQALINVSGARVLALLGDSVTTDHISPAGAIPLESPTATYLREHGVQEKDFNSYGSRRGNHEVMMRGTFGNIRLRNQLAPGTEGGWTVHFPDCRGDRPVAQMSIYDAAMKYQEEGTPLVVIAGKEYGTGSSRDWAAKGTALLGVKAVLATSFERIHRSNLIGMGVLPLQFEDRQDAKSLGLTGEEVISIEGIADGLSPRKKLQVKADEKPFSVLCRIDTPDEVEYYRHGGILKYVLRQIVGQV
jgi:aconitate hydratase